MRIMNGLMVTHPLISYYLYGKNLGGMSKQTYRCECAKYARLLINHSNRKAAREVHAQIHAFTHHSITLISDSLQLSENPCEPIVVTVVKDDLERMTLFFEHYRKLGVKQFVVVDNSSTDGTSEWVAGQQGTRCYKVTEPFQTERKVAWIEKVLALTGYNRWYVVVDSDELLDYVGSEQHNLKDLILHAGNNGYKHLNGYMLDMYSDQPLFTEECRHSDIVSRFRFFDASGYTLQYYHSRIIDTEISALGGGPRARIFNKKGISLSKQSVFCYGIDKLYCNPHYLWPYDRWDDMPCSYVLRHYKFLRQDLGEFEKRVEEKSFWNGSVEYRSYIDAYHGNSGICMMHNESKEYTSSHSLSALPFLESPF